MARLTYPVAPRINKLHEELRAAGVTPGYVGGDYCDVPDAQAATAQAVIAAHDPATPSAGEQAEPQDATDLADYRAQYQAMRDQATAGITAANSARTAAQTDRAASNGTLSTANLSAMVRNLQDRQIAQCNREAQTYEALRRLLRGLEIWVRRQGA